MPSRSRLCWCLGGTKPEISYNAADNGGLQLVPLEAAEPMPTDAAELDAKFAELVVSSSFHHQYHRCTLCIKRISAIGVWTRFTAHSELEFTFSTVGRKLCSFAQALTIKMRKTIV